MNNTKFLILHIGLGLAGVFAPAIAGFYMLFFFFYALMKVFQTSNKTGWAHLGAAYVVGIEVWLRMNKSFLFWEFGKLAAIVLLVAGLLVSFNRRMKLGYLFISLLLLPSLFLTEEFNLLKLRGMITFQLSGMILLSVSSVYFANRIFNIAQFQKLCLYLLGPIIAIAVEIILKSPDFSSAKVGLYANFSLSGGFGPNQVSTILGLGIVILTFNFLVKQPPFFNKRIDQLILLLLIFRCLLTFSRGGIVVVFFVITLGYLTYLVRQGVNIRKVFSLVFLGVSVLFVFLLANKLTQGVLLDRFKGETYATKMGFKEVSLSTASSGRVEIIKTDFAIWRDHPVFGAGVGMSNVLRPKYGYENISHIEQTRWLAEHGIFGFLVFLLIVFYLIKGYFTKTALNSFILVSFSLLSFLTMLHSATRLAMVGFCFGLGLIYLNLEKNSLSRK